MPEMYAGAVTLGAEDAWYEVATDFEHWDLNNIPFVGGTVDIAKCCDQILRMLLYALAKAAGMPVQILDAYRRFQEALLVHNTIAGGVGTGFKRRCGIPQGCPLSMMFTAVLMRAWILLARSL